MRKASASLLEHSPRQGRIQATAEGATLTARSRGCACQHLPNTWSDPERSEWDREGAGVGNMHCQKGGTIKIGTSQRRKLSALSKCSRQVEFKAANEQRLGRKKRQWKRGSRRGEDLLSMELG